MANVHICRHEMFTEYKGHRPPFPEEIKEAIPQLTALLKSLNVPLLREPGVEADDVIGSLTIKAHSEGFQVAIVSPDKVFSGSGLWSDFADQIIAW